MTATAQAMFEQYVLFLEADEEQKDIRPLQRAAARHLMSGKVLLAELAPTLAILYFAAFEFDGGKFRWLFRSMCAYSVWINRSVLFRNRPMWNDFLMALWQLSRDPRYVGKLYWHLRRAVQKKREQQVSTGAWMICSVCQQDSIFAEHWSDALHEHGYLTSPGSWGGLGV